MLTLFLCMNCWLLLKKTKTGKFRPLLRTFTHQRVSLVFQRYGYYNSGILENKAGFLKNKLDKTEQCKDEN